MTDSPPRVLYVEDDAKLASLTSEYLRGHGVEVTWVGNGEDALARANRQVFDVVLLDVMLPRLDGLAVCRELRACTDVAVIMVTARGEEADRVMGLELGADDYLVKPYSSRELLARVRAQVRRIRGAAAPASKVLHVGKLSLDPGALTVTLAGRAISVTSYEFSILRALAERAGRVLSREQLLDLVKGADEVFDRSIDVHISHLRQRLEVDSRRPQLIKTVRGVGYLLAAEDDGDS